MPLLDIIIKYIKARRKTKMFKHILKAVNLADPNDPEQAAFLNMVRNYRMEQQMLIMGQQAYAALQQMGIIPSNPGQPTTIRPVSITVSTDSTLVDKEGKPVIN